MSDEGPFTTLIETLEQLTGEVRKLQRVVAQDAYFNQREAADYLSISVDKLKDWVDAGHITTINVDGMVRYSREILNSDMARMAVRKGAAMRSDTNANVDRILGKVR